MNRIITISALFILVAFNCIETYSQEKEKESSLDIYAGLDLMNRFIWRGMDIGGRSPSIQPYMGIMIKNFELGVWGAYSVGGNNSNQEIDIYAAYHFGKGLFSLMLTDYYSASDIFDYNYFDYNKETTGHFYEASLKFNGNNKIPVSFLAAMNFYGADALKINNDPTSEDFNQSVGIQYSNYFEFGYTKDIKQFTLNAFLGFTLNNPIKADTESGYIGEIGFYGQSPGVIHTGISLSKDIPVTEKFSLPLTSSIITNPQTEKVFFLVGFSF